MTQVSPEVDLPTEEILSRQLEQMNQASREFVLRLRYLQRDRRLLADEDLNKVLLSGVKLNPLDGRVIGVSLLPHREAFAELLEEDLQWEQIRGAVETLLATAGQNKQRAQLARQQTELVLMPVMLKNLPFSVQQTVLTEQGQILGLNYSSRVTANTPMTLKTYDLRTGQRLAEFNYDGHLDSDATTTSRFFYFKGRPLKIAAVAGEIQLFDALSGATEALPVVNGSGELVAVKGPLKSSGTLGNSLYFADTNGVSYLLDPSGQTPTQINDKLTVLTTFRFQGKTFGFGVEPKRRSESSVVTMRIFDFSTGEGSAGINVPLGKEDLPKVSSTFEQDGRPFALVRNQSDVFVVDLMKAQITQRLSATPLGNYISVPFKDQLPDRATFSFHGKTYVPAVIRGVKWTDPKRLVILDAQTLLPASPETILNADVSHFEVIKGTDGEVFAIVGLSDGTSRLIGLVTRPQARP